MRYFLLSLSLLAAASSYAGIPRVLTPEELDTHRELAEPFSSPHIDQSLSSDKMKAREEKFAPVVEEVIKADAGGHAAIKKNADFNLQGDNTVRVFLEKVGEKDITIPSEPVSAPAAVAKADTLPATVKTDKTEPLLTTITCEDGLYFDVEKGLLVYLKNVVMIDPRFSLRCDDQLKAYLHQKPKKEKKKKADPSKETAVKLPAGLENANFSGVDSISAMGNVVMVRKDPKTGKEVEIYGQKATYNGKTGEIIVSGGDKQTVKQGINITEVTGKNSYIHVDPAGNVRFNGRINGTANMESLQKDKKNKKGKDASPAFPGKK